MKALLALAVTASALATGLSLAATPSGAEVLVTRDSLSLRSGCSPRQVAAVVNRFFDAFNRGDAGALDQLFVKEDTEGRPVEPAGRSFRWYSVTEGGSVATRPWRHRAIYDRPDLLAYLAERHAQHERLQLVALDTASSWVKGGAGFGFQVRRVADDLPPGLGGRQRIAQGKAELDCRAQRLYLWTMGMDMAPGRDYPEHVRWACPVPSGWAPGKPAIACARTGRAPTAPEIAPSYRPTSSSVEFPSRCAPGAVEARLLRLLRALNVGNGTVLARSFVGPRLGPSQGLFLRRQRLASRSALTEYAAQRYEAGVGWTLLVLNPPSRVEGPYRLLVRVGGRGAAPVDSAGQILVDCRTGLIRRLALRSIAA